METSSGEKVTGERITLTLHPVDRKLAAMEAVAATGKEVTVTLLEGRYTFGQIVTYDAATDRYLVKGTPAKFVAPAQGRPGECTVWSGTDLRFDRTSGSASVGNQGGAKGTSGTVKCAEVIK